MLAEVGWAGALLYNEATGRLIDGHLRKEVSSPDDEIPVLIGSWTEDQEAVILATLDPIAAMADADKDQLAALLEAVESQGEGVQELLDQVAEDNRIQRPIEAVEDPGAQIDKAEELQAKWKVERGQIWQAGKHRVMCGDSTSAEDVAKLMAGDKAGLMLTDPPYGIGYEYASHDDSDVAKYRRLCKSIIEDWLPVCRAALVTVGPRHHNWWIVNSAPEAILLWFDKTKQSGHKVAHLCKSECILVFGKLPAKYAWDTFEVQGSRGDGLRELHTCPKPLELYHQLIEPQAGMGVCDPFLGSGTTLVACEQLNRIGYGMEIEPKYVAVTLERLSGMGLTPELVE